MTKEPTLTEKATQKANDLLNRAPGASQVRDLLDRSGDESSEKKSSTSGLTEKLLATGIGSSPPEDLGKITKLVRQLFSASEIRQNARDEDFAGDDASPVQVTLRYTTESPVLWSWSLLIWTDPGSPAMWSARRNSRPPERTPIWSTRCRTPNI